MAAGSADFSCPGNGHSWPCLWTPPLLLRGAGQSPQQAAGEDTAFFGAGRKGLPSRPLPARLAPNTQEVWGSWSGWEGSSGPRRPEGGRILPIPHSPPFLFRHLYLTAKPCLPPCAPLVLAPDVLKGCQAPWAFPAIPAIKGHKVHPEAWPRAPQPPAATSCL